MTGPRRSSGKPAAMHQGRNRIYGNEEKPLANSPTRFTWTGKERREYVVAVAGNGVPVEVRCELVNPREPEKEEQGVQQLGNSVTKLGTALPSLTEQQALSSLEAVVKFLGEIQNNVGEHRGWLQTLVDGQRGPQGIYQGQNRLGETKSRRNQD